MPVGSGQVTAADFVGFRLANGPAVGEHIALSALSAGPLRSCVRIVNHQIAGHEGDSPTDFAVTILLAHFVGVPVARRTTDRQRQACSLLEGLLT